jgi:hypothetical protein
MSGHDRQLSFLSMFALLPSVLIRIVLSSVWLKIKYPRDL